MIFKPGFDIVDVISFFVRNPMGNFSKIALNKDAAMELQAIIRDYMAYSLDISHLKSDDVIDGKF